jgi:Ca-activated chloride channel family protein
VVAGLLLTALGLVPLAAGAGPAAAVDEQADNSLLLLLDSSGSMQEDAGGGQTRIAAAKQALDDLVGELPDSSNVGLRVYGATKDSGCDDTTLVSPVGPLDRAGLRKAIRGFQPRGDTPIGISLKAAADDLKDAPGRKTIVLVSDGEDTCTPPSTCEVARDLAQQGVDLRVEAIGFQVGAEARQQLACVAKVTGGSYYDAPDARALSGQLQALSLRAFRSFEPLGTPITGTPDAAGAPEMTPGAWVDELAPGESRSYAIEVTAGAVPVVNAALIAGATQPRLGGPENFVVTLSDPDGNECARGTSSQSSTSFTAAATATGARAAEGTGSACTEPGPRVLTVQRQFTSGQGINTVEILFSQIGEPDPAAEPAPPVQPGPAGGSAGDATPVRGGTSYNDAPVLGPGVWKDTIRSSETIYYRVPVGWGQSLTADVRFDLITTGEGSAGQMQPLVEVHDALRADPGNRQIAQLTGGAPRQVTIETPAVTGPAAATDPVTPFKIAGDEYVVINGSDLLGDAQTAAASVQLNLAVEGEQVEGPRLAVVGATSGPTPDASTPSATDPAAKGDDGAADDSGDGAVPALVWLLLAVVVIGAVVAGVALATRGRRARG